MNKILEWFTRKRIFIISFIIFIINIIANYSVELGICFNYPNKCNNNAELVIIYSFIFIFIFIFSVITYYLNKSIFIYWRNFSIFWVLFSLIIISFLPNNTHGLDYLPITKGSVIIFFSILYSIISILVIIYHFIKNKYFK